MGTMTPSCPRLTPYSPTDPHLAAIQKNLSPRPAVIGLGGKPCERIADPRHTHPPLLVAFIRAPLSRKHDTMAAIHSCTVGRTPVTRSEGLIASEVNKIGQKSVGEEAREPGG